MVAAAMIGSAVVGAGATAYSGRKAASAAERAANRASNTELAMYDQTREDQAPYRAVGESALDKLSSLYGLNTQETQPMTMEEFLESDQYTPQQTLGSAFGSVPVGLSGEEQYNQYTQNFQPETVAGESSAPDYSQFYESPDYNFAREQGESGVNRMLAKKGLVGSGAEMKAMARFNQGLASQTFDKYRNSLQAMAGIGQTSTNTTGAIGTQVAGNVGANQRMAGDARASSYLNTGAAVNNVADSYGQYSMLQAGGYLK